jgi:hypothetical protein
MSDALRLGFIRALFALLAAATLAASSAAQASFLDDGASFGEAMTALRAAVGEHPRVLRIEVAADRVAIEAQDPQNRDHVDRWQYGVINLLRVFPIKRLSGPEGVRLQLLNPDLEANLFDLEAVDLSAMPQLVSVALARAQLRDKAAVTHFEIGRQTFILPSPTSGDIRWTLHVDSGREHAEIYANARGAIVGADLGQTQRAQRLNLFDEPALVADAAAAFRARLGAAPALTRVGVSAKMVSFATNLPDEVMASLRMGVPATASFTWDLNGLQRRIGNVDANAMMKIAGPATFSVDDVDWTVLAQLERDALARVAIAKAKVTEIAVASASDQPGASVLLWTVEIMESGGEVTSVVADLHGAIKRVVLPESRRPKVGWLDPATIAGRVARITPTFGADARIASIVFDDRGGRITVDDRANGGRPATFDFSADGVTRSSISFMLESTGPRFGAADIAPLDEAKIGELEAQALKRLAAGRTVWLESLTIGPHLFVRQAGARAIEVRVRDVAEDSIQAHYAWIVFDFNGRVLDLSAF